MDKVKKSGRVYRAKTCGVKVCDISYLILKTTVPDHNYHACKFENYGMDNYRFWRRRQRLFNFIGDLNALTLR